MDAKEVLAKSDEIIKAMGLSEDSFDEGDEIDPFTYKWYESKFREFIEDGVREAINAYLHHACQRTDINDITKVAIMQLALNI